MKCPHCGADLQQVQRVADDIVKGTVLTTCCDCNRRIVITPSAKPETRTDKKVKTS